MTFPEKLSTDVVVSTNASSARSPTTYNSKIVTSPSQEVPSTSLSVGGLTYPAKPTNAARVAAGAASCNGQRTPKELKVRKTHHLLLLSLTSASDAPQSITIEKITPIPTKAKTAYQGQRELTRKRVSNHASPNHRTDFSTSLTRTLMANLRNCSEMLLSDVERFSIDPYRETNRRHRRSRGWRRLE